MFRINTNHGYWYTTGNDRYGRLNGQALYTEQLCEKHAQAVAAFLISTGVTNVRLEPGPAGPCPQCRRKSHG